MSTHYLKEANLAAEIYQGKLTRCSYDDPTAVQWDAVVDKIEDISPEVIRDAIQVRKSRLIQESRSTLRSQGLTAYQIEKVLTKPTVTNRDIIIRVRSEEHLPTEYHKGSLTRRPKKLHFAPFVHVKLSTQGWRVVLRSHHTNNIFDATPPIVSRQLSKMLLELTRRLGTRSNWKNYTYLEDMQGEATLDLLQNVYLYDETRGFKSFSYLTRIADNAFKTFIRNEHKKVRDVRLNLIEQALCFTKDHRVNHINTK